MRLSAKQLVAAEEVLKRKLKQIKGAKVYMRVFPDIPVCVKVSRHDSIQRAWHDICVREMKLVWVKEKEHLSFGLHGMVSLRRHNASIPHHSTSVWLLVEYFSRSEELPSVKNSR